MTWDREQIRERRDELRAEKVARCTPADVIRTKDGRALDAVLEKKELDALADRLRHFAPPRYDGDEPNIGDLVCLCCGRRLWGLLGTFQWGIVHGSGSCSECSWPVTVYHRERDNPDGWSLTYPLCAHPDEVAMKGEQTPDDE